MTAKRVPPSQLFEQYADEADGALNLALDELEELETALKHWVIPYLEHQVKKYDDLNAQDILIRFRSYLS